jgi:hypothetical protein
LRLHYSNPFAPIQSLYAGVLWAKPVSTGAAGNFCKITSGRALNRPRSPEVRKPLVRFLVLFAQRKKHEKRSFRRKFRGSANLESAHTNNNLAQNKLNPFSALRRCPCRDGTLRVHFAAPSGSFRHFLPEKFFCF